MFEFKMGFLYFIKFALICFDALAWPLFALGYPLRASIHAIEANSNSDTKKLVTYWVIFSLISLFEHAFMGMLQWLPFWPYMKLTVVCWMMIPDFDGAFCVYNHCVRPCLYIDMQTVTNWFKKQQEFFLKDNFLAETNKYVQAHGTEALEKIIASEGFLLPYPQAPAKGADPGNSIMEKDMKAAQVTEKREVVPVNPIPEIEPNAAQRVNNVIAVPEMKGEASIDPPDIPSDKRVQKEWTCAMCQVTTTSEKTLNSHLQGRRHKDICEELMKAKNQPSKPKLSVASAVKQPSKGQVSASLVAKNSELPSNNASTSSKAANPKTGTNKSNQLKPTERVNGQQKVKIPQFRCIICNINCNRSEDLNSHLWGKKHLARIQELNSLGRGDQLA